MDSWLFCPICQGYQRPTDPSCPSCRRERLPGEIPAEPGKPLWETTLNGQARGSPAVSGGLVLFAWDILNGGGGITAVKQSSGVEHWQKETGHSPQGGPLIRDNQVFLATSSPIESSLTCWHLENGKQIWSKTVSGFAYSLPCLGEKCIYLASNDGRVYAFDSESGELVRHWPVQLEPGKLWLLQTATGLAAVCESGSVYLLSLDPAETKPVAACSFGAVLTSPPTLHKSTFYCGGKGGLLLALDIRTGKPRTLADDFKKLVAAPLCTPQALYAAGHDHSLRAFNPLSGNPLWQKPLIFEHSVSAALEQHNGLLAVSVNEDALHVVEADTGQEAWSFSFPRPVKLPGGPHMVEGVLYVAGDEYAFAFPWHRGLYAWAAGFKRRQGDLRQSGEFSALAGFYARSKTEKEHFYQQAEADWDELGEPEWAAYMWEGFAYKDKAARAYCRAAEAWRDRQPRQAAVLYMRASQLYWQLDQKDLMNTCASQAAGLGSWPLLRLSPWRFPRLTQGETGSVTARMENIGEQAAYGLSIKLGGSLHEDVSYQVEQPLPPKSYFDVTLELIPTQAENQLHLQVEYLDHPSGLNPSRATLDTTITANEPLISVENLGRTSTGYRIRISDSAQQTILEDRWAMDGAV